MKCYNYPREASFESNKMAMKMQRTDERTYSGSISKVANLYLDAEMVLHDSQFFTITLALIS